MWPRTQTREHWCNYDMSTQGRDRPGYMERWDEWEQRRREIDASIANDTPRSRPLRLPTDPVPLASLDDAPYVELHLHSCYSLLDGASRVDELVDAAHALGYRALALTDHDGMFGALEFARALKETGLRTITGLELTVAEASTVPETAGASAAGPGERTHITLLAETRRGYANLCRLSSLAFGLGLTGCEGERAAPSRPVGGDRGAGASRGGADCPHRLPRGAHPETDPQRARRRGRTDAAPARRLVRTAERLRGATGQLRPRRPAAQPRAGRAGGARRR